MKEEPGTQLQPSQLRELELMGAMVARGESPSALQSRWKKLVAQVVRSEPTTDINGLIQVVLRESYLEANEDLQFYAARVEYYNSVKKQIRDSIQQAHKLLDDYIASMEQKLSSVGDDAQLANIDLQNMLQKQQQTIQMLSNVSKVLHDTALAVVRKIG